MAEGEAAAAGGKGAFDFLATKLGPAPIAVWGLGALVAWYWFQSKKKASSSGGAGGSAPNQQVDPAGNVGSIDPSTGYVYGSPEDQAAIASNANAGGSSGGGSSPSTGSGTTTAGQYTTNADWSRAAENYLVGLGIDPTAASQALQQYLSSQVLTSDQQGDVNLAIQALGAPPELPTAAQQNPNPNLGGSGSGGGQVNATNPVTGVAPDANVSSSTLAIRWNAAANATSYNVQVDTDPSFAHEFTTTAPATQTSVTLGNGNPNTTYYLRVQAQPAAAGAPWSETVSVTTSAAGVGTGRGGPEAPITIGSGGQVVTSPSTPGSSSSAVAGTAATATSTPSSNAKVGS